MTEPQAAKRRSSRARLVAALVAALAVLLVAAVGVALAFTSQPSYFVKYHDLAARHTRLESSSHKDIPCITCHAPAGGPVVEDAQLVAEFYTSMFETTPTLTYFSFAPPRSEACLSCHAQDWSDEASLTARVPHPAHLRVQDETRPCVKCHKWIAHEETYQAAHKKMPFSAVCASFGCHVGVKQPADCVNCHHVLQNSLADWVRIHPATVAKVGSAGCLDRCHTSDQCLECHTTGKVPVVNADFTTASSTAIGNKHVQPDWLTVHGPLALSDPALCKTCHVSEGECLDCHSIRPAFHGSTTTWLKAHQPLGANKARCLTCHQQSMCDACHQQFQQVR